LPSSNVIQAWNATLINTIEAQGTPPLPASRSMAMVHVAMYDAVVALDPAYTFYALPGLADKPPPAAHAFPEVAAARAADAVLDSLYPAQAATFDAQLQSFLTGYPSHGQAISDSLSWGQTVARAVVSWRSTDGSGAVVPYTPGTAPGVWQPTPPGFLPALAPQWASVVPWAMTSGSQFRPPPPPALTSTDYATAFNEVKNLGRIDSTTRTPDQTQIALFWKDALGTAYAFGHWNKIAEGVSEVRRLDLVDSTRLFALLNIATADALISCWDGKYTYNFWRPVTAIGFSGDSSINPATVSDPTWTPLIVTPNFPSYASAHSTVSGAAAGILTALFGPHYRFTTGSDGLPDVARSFASFEAAAAEAGQSRIYGGIHFQFDNQGGLASGGALGQFVFHNFLVPVEQEDDQGDNSAVPMHVAFGSDLVERPAAPEAIGPTPLSPAQRAPALAAAPVDQDQPTRRAPAPYRLVGQEADRGRLDPLFTNLDGGTLADAL
jgi:membrane-associated phospholipid phosphatase